MRGNDCDAGLAWVAGFVTGSRAPDLSPILCIDLVGVGLPSNDKKSSSS